MAVPGRAGPAAARKPAVPLAQRRLRELRGLPGRALVRPAQDHPSRAARGEAGLEIGALYRRRPHRRALGRLLRLLHGHRRAQMGPALSQPPVLLPARRADGRQGAADHGPARRALDRRRAQPDRRATASTAATGAAWRTCRSCTSSSAITRRSNRRSSDGWRGWRPARRASTRSPAAICPTAVYSAHYHRRPGPARTGRAVPRGGAAGRAGRDGLAGRGIFAVSAGERMSGAEAVKAPWPPDGRTARASMRALFPCRHDHCAALAEAVRDGELWRLWYTSVAAPEDMADDIERRLACARRASCLPFTVIERASGEPVGMTTYMNIDAVNRRVEIGATWYRRRVQRTPLNTECKLMLLAPRLRRRSIASPWSSAPTSSTPPAAGPSSGSGRSSMASCAVTLWIANGALRDTCVYASSPSEWPTVRQNLTWQLERAR